MMSNTAIQCHQTSRCPPPVAENTCCLTLETMDQLQQHLPQHENAAMLRTDCEKMEVITQGTGVVSSEHNKDMYCAWMFCSAFLHYP